MLLLFGAIAIAILPSAPFGKPLWILFHVFPLSTDLYRALVFPPEVKPHPERLNSHIDAYKVEGSLGSIIRSAAPVAKPLYKIFSQVFPPSLDL